MTYNPLFEDFLRENLCGFPKHRGRPWYDVIQRDREYVTWLLENKIDPDDEDELHEALTWGVKHVPDTIG